MHSKIYWQLCCLLTIILFFQKAPIGFSQNNFDANLIFLTWHPGGDEMYFLQPRRLDARANLVLNYGGVLAYEHFVYKKRLSLKLAQAAYSDCAALFAGHTHIAFRWNVLSSDRHALRLGFGPTWFYRQSWERFPGYIQQNPYLKTRGDWQYSFVWYGGEIEYDYALTNRWNLGVRIIPGIPSFFTFGVGIRYWLNPVPSTKYWRQHPELKKWFYTQRDLEELK